MPLSGSRELTCASDVDGNDGGVWVSNEAVFVFNSVSHGKNTHILDAKWLRQSCRILYGVALYKR